MTQAPPPAGPSPTSEQAYRAALRQWVSGVTVVTYRVDDTDHASTVSAFTSLSLDPPQVLICIGLRARFAERIDQVDFWGVSVLAEDAGEDAAWLAKRGRPLVGQLDRVPHHRCAEGYVLLDRALAWLCCRTASITTSGDHLVVVGDVVRADVAETGRGPLAYWNQDFRALQIDPPTG